MAFFFLPELSDLCQQSFASFFIEDLDRGVALPEQIVDEALLAVLHRLQTQKEFIDVVARFSFRHGECFILAKFRRAPRGLTAARNLSRRPPQRFDPLSPSPPPGGRWGGSRAVRLIESAVRDCYSIKRCLSDCVLCELAESVVVDFHVVNVDAKEISDVNKVTWRRPPVHYN